MKLRQKAMYLVLAITIFIGGAYAMAVADVGKVCLFSEMSGIVTLNGSPVINAKLVRTVDWNGSKSDEARSDAKGRFHFPAVYERAINKYLPQEFVVSQKIVLYSTGNEYEIWWGTKRAPEHNLESKGKPLIVTCELTDISASILVGLSSFHGLCRWDAESDKPVDWDETDLFEP